MKVNHSDRQHVRKGVRQLEALYMQAESWKLDRFERIPEERMRARISASLLGTDVESVLDVGCGNGFVTSHFKAQKRVVGLDPSPVALAEFPGESVVGYGDNLSFADLSFDAVVCLEVLEHLEQDVFERSITELARVARSYLLVSVPYRQDLRREMVRCAECGLKYHADLHRRSFRDSGEFERLFPGFKREALVLLGECVRVRSRLYRSLRSMMLGADHWSAFARCPACASSETVPRDQVGWKPVRWIFANLGWRMPKQRVPRWMIVLLKRQVNP